MEALVTVLIIEIQQDERATPSGTGTPAPPLPASGSLCPATCPPTLLLLRVHHWHPLEDTKGSVAHSHPALLPSPDLLDGRHHLLDVILGPAPGLGPHGPAGHAGGAGAEAEPPVRRAQARRQAGAPLSRPGLSSLRELAAPSLDPQRLRESPPRFLPPRPAPASLRSGRAARAARAQAWKPAGPAPTGPAPSGRPDAQRPLPATGRKVGGSSATGRARRGCGRAFRPLGRQGAREDCEFLSGSETKNGSSVGPRAQDRVVLGNHLW